MMRPTLHAAAPHAGDANGIGGRRTATHRRHSTTSPPAQSLTAATARLHAALAHRDLTGVASALRSGATVVHALTGALTPRDVDVLALHGATLDLRDAIAVFSSRRFAAVAEMIRSGAADGVFHPYRLALELGDAECAAAAESRWPEKVAATLASFELQHCEYLDLRKLDWLVSHGIRLSPLCPTLLSRRELLADAVAEAAGASASAAAAALVDALMRRGYEPSCDVGVLCRVGEHLERIAAVPLRDGDAGEAASGAPPPLTPRSLGGGPSPSSPHSGCSRRPSGGGSVRTAVDLVAALLRRGADPNAAGGLRGRRPLHSILCGDAATGEKSVTAAVAAAAVVPLLLAAGADAAARTDAAHGGVTPLLALAALRTPLTGAEAAAAATVLASPPLSASGSAGPDSFVRSYGTTTPLPFSRRDPSSSGVVVASPDPSSCGARRDPSRGGVAAALLAAPPASSVTSPGTTRETLPAAPPSPPPVPSPSPLSSAVPAPASPPTLPPSAQASPSLHSALAALQLPPPLRLPPQHLSDGTALVPLAAAAATSHAAVAAATATCLRCSDGAARPIPTQPCSSGSAADSSDGRHGLCVPAGRAGSASFVARAPVASQRQLSRAAAALFPPAPPTVIVSVAALKALWRAVLFPQRQPCALGQELGLGRAVPASRGVQHSVQPALQPADAASAAPPPAKPPPTEGSPSKSASAAPHRLLLLAVTTTSRNGVFHQLAAGAHAGMGGTASPAWGGAARGGGADTVPATQYVVSERRMPLHAAATPRGSAGPGHEAAAAMSLAYSPRAPPPPPVPHPAARVALELACWLLRTAGGRCVSGNGTASPRPLPTESAAAAAAVHESGRAGDNAPLEPLSGSALLLRNRTGVTAASALLALFPADPWPRGPTSPGDAAGDVDDYSDEREWGGGTPPRSWRDAAARSLVLAAGDAAMNRRAPLLRLRAVQPRRRRQAAATSS